MEKTENKELIIGIDFENLKSIMDKTGFSKSAIYERIKKLERRGVIIKPHYNVTKAHPSVYWLKEDADKIINAERGTPVTKWCTESQVEEIPEGIDYETENSLIIKSKYKTIKDLRRRIINLEKNSGVELNTKFSDIHTRYWLKVDADKIISYRKKRSAN